MAGRLVGLVPVRRDHLPSLYTMVTHPDTAPHWRFRGGYPSPEQFEQTLWQDVAAQFALEQRGRCVGWVVAYKPEFAQGHVHVAACSAPESLGTGAAIEGLGLLIDHLWRAWPLRKVYMETSERSYPQFASGEGRIFEVEGRLRQHEFYDGRRWDKLVLALYEEHVARIRGLLGMGGLLGRTASSGDADPVPRVTHH